MIREQRESHQQSQKIHELRPLVPKVRQQGEIRKRYADDDDQSQAAERDFQPSLVKDEDQGEHGREQQKDDRHADEERARATEG